MSRRRFDPRELDEPPTDGDRSVAELQRYAMTTDADAPGGLADRVMAAIEREPAPRRGFLAWLTSPSPVDGGQRNLVRVTALAATLVLAVAAALYAGQLADLVRTVGAHATPTPSVAPSPSQAPSVTPVPSPSVAPSPSSTPEASDDHGGAGQLLTPVPTPHETPGGTPEETKTPRPSPTVTATPSATPQQGS
jgi:hypothetical protein